MDTQTSSQKLTSFSAQDSIDAAVIVLVMLAFYVLGSAALRYVVKNAVERSRQKTWHRKDIEKRQKTLVGVVVNIWRILVIFVGGFQLLQIVFPSINTAPLFASAGIVGVAIGFGSQALVKDFLSGIFIISENQYRVGDIIDINGSTGTVERIGTRSTVIRDNDGNVHYFPNGSVQHVINKTMGYSMARFSIGVHPSNDLDKIISIINETGKKLAGEEKWKNKIIDAPTFESIGEFTPSTVQLFISGKTQPSDQWSVTAEMRRRLLFAFEKSKIEL
ncbi:MAG: mechanosensitive ion channel protein MscS, small conductance mechanosensitive channel [Candidatus Saccharibacteria bacterium]|jgi:small-conductance mechanosensitive channel|nr:mechanosensitive ion channel protein MscS, small conductance mechanosensitive channel [Candidatus Saccharibacteria bacterium]